MIAVQGIAPAGPIPVADRSDGRDRAPAGFAEGVDDVLAAAGGGTIAGRSFLHELVELSSRRARPAARRRSSARHPVDHDR